MSSPAEACWRIAYKYRSEAHRQRAKADDIGAELVGAASNLPGSHGETLNEILAALHDPATAAKATGLANILRAEIDAVLREEFEALGLTPSDTAVDQANARALVLRLTLVKIGDLANHLEAAVSLDKGARAMTDMGDDYANRGH